MRKSQGFNVNIPLSENTTNEEYHAALAKMLLRIKTFKPNYLVVALGLDTAKADPTGSWNLVAENLKKNGRMIGDLGLPTLVVQEGGYRTRTLGFNARFFLRVLMRHVHQESAPLLRAAARNRGEPHNKRCQIYIS